MPVKRLFVCIFLVLCSGFVAGQRIEFFKEELVFTLDSSCFSVNGDYYFRNPGKAEASYRVFYPVSKTGGFRAIDTIVVYDLADPLKPLRVEVDDSVASFSLNFRPASEKCVKIVYRQHHNGHRARYILLTTRRWNIPLERARYTLVMDGKVTLSHCSISPDTLEDFGQTRLYYWNRIKFMPDEDFVFEITRKP